MQSSFLEVRNLSHGFARFPALKELSFDVREGEIVSLVGPSGCGKTVLLRLLAGLLELQSGDIRWSRASRLAMAFQSTALFPWLTLRENLAICINQEGISEKERGERAREALAVAHLERFGDHYPSEVSGGMAQRVNVLRCFASGADFILMDEPFVHLDFLQRTELLDFTLSVWGKDRKTILFVTHDIDEAIYLSDRIVVLSGSPASVKDVLSVTLPRPRSPEAIRSHPDYIGLFSRVRSLLASGPAGGPA